MLEYRQWGVIVGYWAVMSKLYFLINREYEFVSLTVTCKVFKNFW